MKTKGKEMMKRILFLSVLLWGTSAVADVPFLAFRFNEDGKVIDISTDVPVGRAEETGAGTGTTVPAADDTTQTEPTIKTAVEICVEKEGTMIAYGGQTYCCNATGHVLNTETGNWSQNPLIPQCGCGTYRTSFKKNTTNNYVCCDGYKMVSSQISGDGVDIEDSDLCGCPEQFELNGKTVKVRDITAEGSSDLICCAKGNKLQSDNNSLPWAACQCEEGLDYDDNDECVPQCSEKYPTVCKDEISCSQYGFWCGEEGAKHCVVKETCPTGKTQSGTTCACEGEACSAIALDACGSESTCKDVGGTWCPFDKCTQNINECVCENGGTLNAEAGVCCKDGWRAVAGSDGYDALSITDCGCPKNNGAAITINAKGACCVGQKKYNETTKAYDTNHEDCCVAANTEWDEDKNTCVCKDGLEFQTDGTCGCAEGMIWSESRQSCVYCTTSEHCSSTPETPYCKTDGNNNLGKCVACLYSEHCGNCEKDKSICDTSFYGGTYTCKSCREINPAKPWRGKALSDPTSCNSCYECIEDNDCGTGEVCSQGTCVRCVHYQTKTTDTPNRGCGADAPFCIGADDNKNQCVQCVQNSDCADGTLRCNTTTHTCEKDCGDAGTNPETGECNCTGNTPVFNPNTRKCVACYDSISEDWTDLGCGSKKTDAEYDPTETAIERRPICLEESNNGLGACVACTKDRHCGTGEVCRADHTCGCETGTIWYETAQRCVSCTANYGGDEGTDGRACPQSTPTCDPKTYTCKCARNYDGTTGNGICTAETPVCDSKDKYCRVCGTLKPNYSVSEKACVSCGSHAKWDATNQRCQCVSGYGVLTDNPNKGCVSANLPTVRSCSDIQRTVTKNCPEIELFSFTTAKGVLYQVKFTDTMTVDDKLRLECDKKIISPGKTDAGTMMTEKQWCRNKSSSGSIECTKANKTQVTNSNTDTVYIRGDGSNCAMYIANVTDDCTANACSGGPVSVTVVNKTFSYLSD